MIIDVSDILTFLGNTTTVTATERAQIGLFTPGIEGEIIKFLGYDPAQAEKTEFLPQSTRGPTRDPLTGVGDIRGDTVFFEQGNAAARYLFLPRRPLRSIDSLYEDPNARAGDNADDFGADTLLTKGTHYFVDWDSSGLSKSGKLIKVSGYWAAEARTVKITYTAGYTAVELATGIGAPIKLAALLTAQSLFSKTGTGSGTVEQERLGDYSVKYAVEKGSVALTPKAQALLQPFVAFSGRLG